MKKYQIACIQASIEVIDDPADKTKIISRNIERGLNVAEGSVVQENAKVIVFPEGWLQGFNHTRQLVDWKAICIQIPGPETEKIGEFTKRHQIYLAATAFEYEPDWPNVWFATGFIVGPSGTVELRYRKIHEHNVEGLIPNVSPADVHDEYLKRYGKDSLFPVLDTPYGRLAIIIEHDINFFELSRVLTFHAGSIVGKYSATHASRGCTTMINYLGNVDSAIEGAGESVLVSTVDLNRLRKRRTEVFMNYPAQVKSELFGREFSKRTFLKINTGPSTKNTAEITIKRLQEEGIFAPPE